MAQTKRGFLAWLQDNARILLSIALVLFLLFAVYSYSNKRNSEQTYSLENDAQSSFLVDNEDDFSLDGEITDIVIDGEEGEVLTLGDDSESLVGIGGGPDDTEVEVVVEGQKVVEQNNALEQKEVVVTEQKVMKKEGNIVISAGSGDGLTHMARRALAEYNTANSVDYLNAAQKVYIEDHLQKMITQRRVHPGTAVSFANGDIATAIQRAQDLSETELANLARYAQRVSAFQ